MWKQSGGGRRGVGAVLAAAAAALAVSGGCGYSIRAPFNNEVKTVYVPIFRSVSFRRDVNLQLTELVIKEIEKNTPYKVVGNADEADTILSGTVNLADKNLIVENPFNLPRQLVGMINVQVSWTHNPPTPEEVEKGPTTIAENINFVPEIGETSLTAFYRCNQAVAKQIVGMMESPW